jgi:hypothetical protein
MPTGIGRADAIGGDWCSTHGMRMSIRSGKMTIPSGKQMEGNYSRHAFDYAGPAAEIGSGDVVSIILPGEFLRYRARGQPRGR